MSLSSKAIEVVVAGFFLRPLILMLDIGELAGVELLLLEEFEWLLDFFELVELLDPLSLFVIESSLDLDLYFTLGPLHTGIAQVYLVLG